MQRAPVVYDDAAHAYYSDGVQLASVTHLLKAAGKIPDLRWYTEGGRERGKAVHAICAATDCWGLWRGPGRPIPWPRYLPPPPEALAYCAEPGEPGEALYIVCPEGLAGYVDAYWAWRRLFQPRWTAIEVPRARPPVAGTADRIGVVRGRPAVVELKASPSEQAWHGLQTAAYDWLDPLPVPRDRFALYLRPDGLFRLRRFDSPDDLPDFLEIAGVAA